MATFTVVAGGHRPAGESPRIARWFQAQLQSRGHTAHLLDLATQDLPFCDEGLWGVEPLAEKWGKLWAPLAEQLSTSDGLILISPEYHGLVPSKLVNFLLLLGNAKSSPVANKPAYLVGVSASVNGAYPIAELRATAGKNNRRVFVPEHLIVRDAANAFKAEDEYLSKRANYGLTLLEDYAQALQHVRNAGHLNTTDYANGM